MTRTSSLHGVGVLRNDEECFGTVRYDLILPLDGPPAASSGDGELRGADDILFRALRAGKALLDIDHGRSIELIIRRIAGFGHAMVSVNGIISEMGA